MAGFNGTKYTPSMGSWFRRLRPGGVVLFGRNIENAEQTAALISDLRKLGEDTNGLPLFVASDQEGGRVFRLPKEYPAFPTARALAKDGSEELTEQTYAQMGEALRGLGFNVDFAPVLDLDTNESNPIIGDRSFAPDPETVSRLGRAAIRGLRRGGVLPCAKHFPGHGDTSLDSHLDLPVDDRPAARFDEAELEPFRMAVEEEVEFIMTAHVVYPAFDDKRPATLSEKIVTGLLREKMGYDGLIITDDMDMKAIAGRWGDEEAAKMAFLAGCDILLVCHEGPRRDTVYETVRRIIIDGEVPDDEVKARLGRVMNAKSRMAALK